MMNVEQNLKDRIPPDCFNASLPMLAEVTVEHQMWSRNASPHIHEPQLRDTSCESHLGKGQSNSSAKNQGFRVYSLRLHIRSSIPVLLNHLLDAM
jgi:hypothetical protein